MKAKYYWILVLITVIDMGCTKDFLEAKPDDALVVPSKLKDLQALLDNNRFMNGAPSQSTGGPTPALLVAGADDSFIPEDSYLGFSLYSKNVYIWDREDPYGGASFVPDWSVPYRAVFYANLVLDGLADIDRTSANTQEWDNLKGSALFYRAYTFYQLAQAFAPLYNKATAATDWGIPLRLKADINEPIERASVQQTYERILADLKEARPLLPQTPLYITRPSAPAVFGLMARVYQTMEEYDQSGAYADSALQLRPDLLDYNTVSGSPTYPLTANKEVIFTSSLNSLPSTELFSTSRARIDTLLYQSYASNDLRRTFFFRLREPGLYSFRGSYESNGFLFTGLAVNELYFIRAEAHARADRTTEALNDLNAVLEKRWKTGTFTPLAAASAEEALELVLRERRKELLMRGLRWSDLRRLNKDTRFAKTLTRVIDGQAYTLPSGDARYTWPIPPDVMGFHPEMPQNPR